jgi:hypothetical protein
MAQTSPFDWLNSINLKTEIDESLIEKEYNPFMVNRGLSYFNDTVFWANEMNMKSFLDKDMQYKFLLNTVKKGKRFGKWAKSEKDETIDMLVEFYQVNRQRAQEISRLLNTKQIQTIREKMFKGGR